MGRSVLRVVLTGLLAVGTAADGAAQPAVRQVLVLHSLERGNLSLDLFIANFRFDLEERAGTAVNVVQVVVGPTGLFVAPEQAIVDFVRARFTNRPNPDLIVTLGGPAATFARKHRAQVFPETPLLLASVDQQFLGDAPLGKNETAVAVVNDFPGLVDEILQLLPQTRQLFVVMGPGPLGTFWRRQLEVDLTRFHGRLTFLWSNDLSLREVLRRCANLPDDSAIFYINLVTDAQGGAYSDERVLADLHATANAPLFARHTPMLGRGVVGGRLLAIEDLVSITADAAIRLLDGAPPQSVRVPLSLPGPPIFDWRELQRWGIAESRLPAGSVVRFRAPSLWSAYQGTVLSVVGVLAVQSLLIVGLLYQRRARQRAEVESRRNLALAADASRRETMSALTGSIAHELGQPLSSMTFNAQALRKMVADNRAPADTIGEILSDIEADGLRATQLIDRHRMMLRSRDMARNPIDLHVVVNESLALVAHDINARQVKAAVHLPPAPCVISGDQVMLQQVLLNLAVNAMDAMTGTQPPWRRLTISSDVRAADVEISISDNGTGLPPEVLNTLFTPFMTTKPHGLGLGLTIVRTILDAHGGSIGARNNPEGGATFIVTLPRSDTPGLESLASSVTQPA